MAPLCAALKPDWGVVTNVGPVHIEFFDSVRAIAEEKAVLLRSLPVAGVAVVWRDDEYGDLLAARAAGRMVGAGVDREADYRGRPEADADGAWTVVERRTGETLTFRMSLPGAHHRNNALVAIAAARQLGVAWDNIRDALEHYVTLPMRWERQDLAGRLIINDAYNANPMSMRAAIGTFRELAVPGRKWLVLGDMLELGRIAADEHVALGGFAAGPAWAGLVTLGALGARIADGAAEAGCPADRLHRCQTPAEAARVLGEQTAAGDALLLKASRGMHFEDVLKELRIRLENAATPDAPGRTVNDGI
jgi:UDP-N-acetylmuramyl pentapeptide synthase